MATQEMKPFEIQAAGFDGSGDTDDRIIWVAAAAQDQVTQAIQGYDATVTEIDGQSVSELGDTIDFFIPQELQALQQRLEEFKASV